MVADFDVVQDHDTGKWQVREDAETVLASFTRLEDAIAFARAALLQRDTGSVVVYTPSGRERETLNLIEQSGNKSIELT